MVFCTFCGFSNCENCCKKTRIYPQAQLYEISDKQTKRGLICKQCDRKFFVKNMVSSSVQKIEAQNNTIKGMVKNYEELNTDAKELTADDQAQEDINTRQLKKLDEEY